MRPGDIVVGNLPIYFINRILKQGARMILVGIPGWPSENRQEADREFTAEAGEKRGLISQRLKTHNGTSKIIGENYENNCHLRFNGYRRTVFYRR